MLTQSGLKTWLVPSLQCMQNSFQKDEETKAEEEAVHAVLLSQKDARDGKVLKGDLRTFVKNLS